MEEAIVIETTEAGLFQSRVTTADASFIIDEPVEAGGLGSGANPYDLLAAALGGCTAMTLKMYAQVKQWPLEHVRVRVLHERNGLDGRDKFTREIELFGALDDEQRQRMLAVSLRCPVHKTLGSATEIETVLVPAPAVGAASGEAGVESHCAHATDCAEAVAQTA
ncbi:MAG TPA: OsmC family protein [Candidatus Tumulicola sp.]|jgi:putative redox protein